MCEIQRLELFLAILCVLAPKSFCQKKIAATTEEATAGDVVNQAWEPQKETTTTFSEATKENDLKDLEIQASHFVYVTRPQYRRQDNSGQSFGQKLRSMLDATSYRGYLRRAYPGIIPDGYNATFDEPSDNVKYWANPHDKPPLSRRFFFSGTNPLRGLFGGGFGGGYGGGYYGEESTKDRCQFVPYQQYGNLGGIGLNGGFPYGTNYHSGELQHGHHFDEAADYGPPTAPGYDYLAQKRDVITRRQGFLADDGYGGHYGEDEEEHGGHHHKGKVHPLGYYYCKKGHCGIDGYCSKKTPDYHRRPVQSLHYHRRPHYTKHHFYNDGSDHQGSSYHHHQGDYEHVGDYHPDLPPY